MKITLEPTEKIVYLQIPGGNEVPARIWEGKTANGIEVHAYITRIAVKEGLPEEVYDNFAEQLKETRKPSPVVQAIPLRMIL